MGINIGIKVYFYRHGIGCLRKLKTEKEKEEEK